MYTLPFLLCLLIALFLPKERKWRRFWNWAGIGLSSFYLILTLANKLVVEDIFDIARKTRELVAIPILLTQPPLIIYCGTK